MTKKTLCFFLVALTLVFLLASCQSGKTSEKPPSGASTTHAHAYGEWKTTREATCTADGRQERYCSCGDMQSKTITATEHSFGEWTTVKQASATETGLKERACTCGEKETQVIEKITIKNTISASEWKSAFDNFGRGDFSTISIDIDERIEEVEDDEVYGYDMTAVANFRNDTISVSGIYFWNDEIDEINDTENFEEDGSTFGEFACSDWMWEFWSELDYLSDRGYSKFTYKTATTSYHAQIEVDGILCDANVYFENGRIIKVTIASTGSNETIVNSVYTYTYN